MKKFIAYVLVALMSYYVISGATFARNNDMFEAKWIRLAESLYSDVSEQDVRRQCRENLTFSLWWSLGAAALWPFFLPYIAMYTGGFESGIWTKYTPDRCWGPELNIIKGVE